MIYRCLRPLLFALPPELSHRLTLSALQQLRYLLPKPKFSDPVTLMGIDFPNRLGNAAGVDKNGDYIAALAHLGFGFIEVGGVTPKAQAGNPKPRLFRLPKDQAIINRMGFNNKGIDYLIERVKQANYNGILGIHITKNRDTPLASAAEDYCYCLEKAYNHASFITINISSPNTPGLRDLQQGSLLASLLDHIKQTQHRLSQQHGHYVPIVIKLAPDMSDDQLIATAQQLSHHAIDGVIATNTTIQRPPLSSTHAKETGGLSGKPLTQQSTHVIRLLRQHLPERPIIASGGIMSGRDAKEKIDAGANLIQLYTGLVYHGPQLIRDCHQAIKGNSL